MNKDWDSLVRQHAEGVVNAAIRVLGNFADAEDVAQEVFAEAFQRWTAQANHHWSGLLRRMAVCRSLDHLRHFKRNEGLPVDISDSSESGPAELAMVRKLEERQRITLLNLPPREAQVFCLHYYECLGQGEIAGLLGITRGAVAKPLCLARSKLGESLSITLKEHDR